MRSNVLLARNSRFKAIRTLAGAIAADATPVTDAVVEAIEVAGSAPQVGNSDGSDKVVFYWTGTNLGGASLNLELHIRDDGNWVIGETVTTLAPNTLHTFFIYGASEFFIRVSNKAGTPADLSIRAFVFDD